MLRCIFYLVVLKRLQSKFKNRERKKCFLKYNFFFRFARDGSDRTKGRDVVVYLANVIHKPEHDVRNLLSRHPNWCHIPALQVKQCYEFLLAKKFTKTDIFHNMHLLLYPMQV